MKVFSLKVSLIFLIFFLNDFLVNTLKIKNIFYPSPPAKSVHAYDSPRCSVEDFTDRYDKRLLKRLERNDLI